MHELSIALSILDVAGEEVERRGGPQVEAIYLKLGPLAGVIKEALISAFELAREATPFATSRLIIEEVPIVVFCSKCDAERAVHSMQDFSCVECDTPSSKLIHGKELELAALELIE
jgi:hydrogenase nickel incorporation protein HypA/HybF